MITKDICIFALGYAKKVYKEHVKIGSLEFLLVDLPNPIDGKEMQLLAIAGSNDGWDWFWNVTLFSWAKIKLGAYFAAKRIHKSKHFRDLRDFSKPLIVTGHSRAGASAPAFFKMFCSQEHDYLVFFNPCPSVRRTMSDEERTLNNAIAFRNKHDIVDKAGILNFGHWYCETVDQPKDQGNVIDDHVLNQWDDRIEEYFGKIEV